MCCDGAWQWPSHVHATEPAQSAGHATEQAQSQRDSVYDEDCDGVVLGKCAEWYGRPNDQTFYDEPSLLLQKRMWAIMSRDKEGLEKELTCYEWCRRVRKHAEPAKSGSASTATEHAATNCFKALAKDLLANEVDPKQQQDARYKMSYDTRTGEISVTNKQRSWINAMLRKNLGDAKVAYFIFNNGLPALLDMPLRGAVPTKAMLQNLLMDDLMVWHASLLQSILDHRNHPDMANARKLSALDQQKWQMQRRDKKRQAKLLMAHGSHLANERDSHKRKFEDMSGVEQQVLEEFETDRSAKQYAKECGKRLPVFRGNVF